jgi:hypothetical protein
VVGVDDDVVGAVLWTFRTWTFPLCSDGPDDDADAAMPRIAAAATATASSALEIVMRKV